MFRTEIKIPTAPFKIDHRQKILTIGSCFAEVVGRKFSEGKFEALNNPFGTVFNPLSIFNLLHLSLDKRVNTDSFVQREQWYSYDLHSSIHANSKEDLEEKINRSYEEVNNFLVKTKVIILTLGTSFVYKNIVTGKPVANCHKVPAEHFEKILLSTEEIIEAFGKLHEKIKTINPEIKFILSVSPVRHSKDSLVLNSVSKSILRTASHLISEKYTDMNYFPAYEIMMDDLRDYRFYKADMIHPNEVAEDYIWTKFKETFFRDETISLLEKWDKIKKALDHKPFNEDGAEYKSFLKGTIEKMKELSKSMDIAEEISMLEQKQ